MISYFITGATGAVGSALVARLHAESDVKVHLLIRGGSDAEIQQRLEGLFRFWGVPLDDEALRSRVRAIRGDMSEPLLGMSQSDYSEVVSQCSRIVHAGGNVRMNLPLEAARHSSVDSMANIVRLASDCSTLEKVEVVSTVGVGGRLSRVPETWMSKSRTFHNTYEQAKAEAEDLLQEHIARHGLPATLHRPSMVIGDSESGKIVHFQIFYYLCEFLSGRQTRGLVPKLSQTQLDTIPVDYVARAIQWSSAETATKGEVLHLCSGPESSLTIPQLVRQIRDVMQARGVELPTLRPVPDWLFLRALPVLKVATKEKHRRSLQNLSLFMDYANDRQQFENPRTQERLAAAAIVLPSPEAYLPKVLDYYLASRGPEAT